MKKAAKPKAVGKSTDFKVSMISKLRNFSDKMARKHTNYTLKELPKTSLKQRKPLKLIPALSEAGSHKKAIPRPPKRYKSIKTKQMSLLKSKDELRVQQPPARIPAKPDISGWVVEDDVGFDDFIDYM